MHLFLIFSYYNNLQYNSIKSITSTNVQSWVLVTLKYIIHIL